MTDVPWTTPVSSAPADHRRGAIRLVAPERGERSRVAATVALGATGQLASVGLLATSAWLISSASLRPPVLSLSVAIGAVQVFALLRGTARYGERLASHDLALRVLSRTRVWAFGQLEPLIPGKWAKNRRGDLLARFVADVDAVQDLYVRAVLPLLATASTAALTVATAAVLDPMSGLVLGVGMVLGAAVVPAVTARLGARGGSRLPALQGRRDALVVEAATGAAEVQVFGAVDRVGQELAKLETEVGREGRRLAMARGGAQAAGAALSGLLVAGVMLVSLPALHAGRISGITVAVLGFLVLATAEPLGGLADGFAVLSTSLAAVHRVAAIADASEPGPGASAASDRAPSGGAPSVVAPRLDPGLRPVPAHPRLGVEDVWVRHDDGPPSLRGLELELDPGHHVAALGVSGSGKTTLGYLLLGFVEAQSGRVTLDGADVGSYDPEAVRGLFAWAPEEPHVFRTSLAANLRLARPDATDAQLLQVLEEVGLLPWLGSLPNGLATNLGEGNRALSGGERQRLGVARALVAGRPIVVLDEPTAHLDAWAEADLCERTITALAGRTLLWMTHRRSHLERFDEVVVLDRGRVVRRGPLLPGETKPAKVPDSWWGSSPSGTWPGGCRSAECMPTSEGRPAIER